MSRGSVAQKFIPITFGDCYRLLVFWLLLVGATWFPRFRGCGYSIGRRR